MTETEEMKRRSQVLHSKWTEERDGYFSLIGMSPSGMGGALAYVAIPTEHPFVGKDYDGLPDYGPEVNGGLTFAEGNVFGWDYGHFQNSGSPETDIPVAIDYFRAHAK